MDLNSICPYFVLNESSWTRCGNNHPIIPQVSTQETQNDQNRIQTENKGSNKNKTGSWKYNFSSKVFLNF